MNLKDFIDLGMLNKLTTERRFFEDTSPRKEIYWITGRAQDGKYKFCYLTRNGEYQEETVGPHLEDKYIGGLIELSDVLLSKNLTNGKSLKLVSLTRSYGSNTRTNLPAKRTAERSNKKSP